MSPNVEEEGDGQEQDGLQLVVGKLLAEEDTDVLREGVRILAQALMDAEVSTHIGEGLYERTEYRTAHRNGYRTRTWDTRVGTVELRVPKVAPGSFFPSLLEPRRRADKALAAVIQEAYVKGISSRKVDDLVRALGMDGISRSEVSRICKGLDKEVEAFLNRPIEGEHPCMWLDATFHKVREGGRVVPMATVVAVGANTEGWRQVLGIAAGPSEDHAFWTSFLRSLLRRGLKGVALVVSDAHEGLKGAISNFLHGATWQRSTSCATCWPRCPRAPKGPWPPSCGSSSPSPITPRPWPSCARWPTAPVPGSPPPPSCWRRAAEDVLAHFHFPEEHRRRLHSTNPLERLHKEVKRRTQMVGILPDGASLIRLAGMLLAEQDDVRVGMAELLGGASSDDVPTACGVAST